MDVAKPPLSSSSSSSSSSSRNSGFFQTITVNQHSSSSSSTRPKITSLKITDTLYGSHTLTSQAEPVLLALLQSPHLTRLAGVHQHGITGLLNLTPKITRLEHSIGAFLIVRLLGASLAEQVAALLHDVSHTSLSHVVDFALTSPGEESYHEAHKSRYLSMSDLPELVRSFADDLELPTRSHAGDPELAAGYMSVFHEESYPLLEYPAPALCADRIDYALRDAVAFGKLDMQEAQQILHSFKAYPDNRCRDRLIVMDDAALALKFATTYNALDRDVWSNPANIDMYTSAGGVIRDAVQKGTLDKDDLWRLSDEEFWERLGQVTDDAGRSVMVRLELEGLRQVGGLPRGTKVRTLDPDVLVRDEQGLVVGYKPLSTVYPAWGVERKHYINARQQLMGTN
ncbi:hypothetical protein V8F06_011653 [Rhypophila decipiens]